MLVFVTLAIGCGGKGNGDGQPDSGSVGTQASTGPNQPDPNDPSKNQDPNLGQQTKPKKDQQTKSKQGQQTKPKKGQPTKPKQDQQPKPKQKQNGHILSSAEIDQLETIDLSGACPASPVPIVCPHYPSAASQNLCEVALAAAKKNGKVFYRWEEKKFADLRIQRNTPYTVLGFSFDSKEISSNAQGGMFYGRGLYMTRSPISTAAYDKNPVGKKAVIAIILAPGTPYLTQKAAQNSGIDYNQVLALDPPFPAAIQATAKIKHVLSADHDYWVLRTNKGVCVKNFTGEFSTTADLLTLKNAPVSESTGNFLHGQAARALQTRIFNPKPRTIPLPREAIYSIEEWENIQPPIKTDVDLDLPREFFWNYAGQCSETLLGGDILITSSADIGFCRAEFPLGPASVDTKGSCTAHVIAEPRITVTLDDFECNGGQP